MPVPDISPPSFTPLSLLLTKYPSTLFWGFSGLPGHSYTEPYIDISESRTTLVPGPTDDDPTRQLSCSCGYIFLTRMKLGRSSRPRVLSLSQASLPKQLFLPPSQLGLRIKPSAPSFSMMSKQQALPSSSPTVQPSITLVRRVLASDGVRYFSITSSLDSSACILLVLMRKPDRLGMLIALLMLHLRRPSHEICSRLEQPARQQTISIFLPLRWKRSPSAPTQTCSPRVGMWILTTSMGMESLRVSMMNCWSQWFTQPSCTTRASNPLSLCSRYAFIIGYVKVWREWLGAMLLLFPHISSWQRLKFWLMPDIDTETLLYSISFILLTQSLVRKKSVLNNSIATFSRRGCPCWEPSPPASRPSWMMDWQTWMKGLRMGSFLISLYVSRIKELSCDALCVIFCHSRASSCILSQLFWGMVKGCRAIVKGENDSKSLLSASFPTFPARVSSSSLVEASMTQGDCSAIRIESYFIF